MSLLDRMKMKTEIARWGGRHPIMSFENVDRNRRDAYYHGLVLGAIVDDKQVDQSERALLDKVGYALGYSKLSVAEIIASVLSFDEAQRFSLLEEVTNVLRGSGLEKCFIAEFSFIWLSHGGEVGLLREWREQLDQRLAFSADPKQFAALDCVTAERLEDLPLLQSVIDGFPADFVDYLLAERYPDGFVRFVESVRGKNKAAKEQERLVSEAKARREAYNFYQVARKLVHNGTGSLNSSIVTHGVALIQESDLQRYRDSLGAFSTLDRSMIIETVALKHREEIGSVLARSSVAPHEFGGSVSGMRRYRITGERERLARIIACLVAVFGDVSSYSCSIINRLLTEANDGAEKVGDVDDERCYWNEHVKPALTKLFSRKD